MIPRFSKIKKITHFIGPVNKNLPPLFINTLPKAGTNLIEECILMGGYRRSWARCWNEKNINKRQIIPEQGRMHIGHLTEEGVIDFSRFQSVFVRRSLWDCLNSYLNYMLIQRNHKVSKFIREAYENGDIAKSVKMLFFTDSNPLGRSLISEYERFYALDLSKYDGIINFEDFIILGKKSKEVISNILNIEISESELLMRAALEAKTSTKNIGKYNIFASIDKDTQKEIMTMVIEKDLYLKNGN